LGERVVPELVQRSLRIAAANAAGRAGILKDASWPVLNRLVNSGEAFSAAIALAAASAVQPENVTERAERPCRSPCTA
jgi:hypothetical protein